MTSDLLEFYKNMDAARILFAFKGTISQNMLTQLSVVLKQQAHEEPQMQILFGIFIELSQNVRHYSAEQSVDTQGKPYGVGVVTVSEEGAVYSISSGNAVAPETAERMAQYCQWLNTLDKAALQRLYKQRLLEDPPEGSKGAGVGLIEIARRSDFPLQFHIRDYKNNLKFLILNARVHKTAP
ncbi:MAG: SiaB family protein kinase [Bacteroidota bacterium]|nr:SiaB family protein kinase [Candidatus Kapabacteria bacterium]MDW8220926.1 SiaB family protein kinase [Bacteroidota bacterium]